MGDKIEGRADNKFDYETRNQTKVLYSFLRHFHESKKSVYLSKVPQNTIKEHANKMIKSGNLIPCKLDLYVTLCTWHSIQF